MIELCLRGANKLDGSLGCDEELERSGEEGWLDRVGKLEVGADEFEGKFEVIGDGASETGRDKSETGRGKSETGRGKSETGRGKSETGGKSVSRRGKSESGRGKSETRGKFGTTAGIFELETI